MRWDLTTRSIILEMRDRFEIDEKTIVFSKRLHLEFRLIVSRLICSAMRQPGLLGVNYR